MRRKTPRPIEPPSCIDCGKLATLTQSQKIYPHRPDLWNRPMWVCECGAYTGCHAGTERPKGRPAGKKTRSARMGAHREFDRLWQAKMRRDGCSKKEARGVGYNWLADQMGMDRNDCHIGFMDKQQAWRVVAICRRFR